jgi:hypothetical protein
VKTLENELSQLSAKHKSCDYDPVMAKELLPRSDFAASCRENTRSLARSHEADQGDVAANGSGNDQTANIAGLEVYGMHDHREVNPRRNGFEDDLEAARPDGRIRLTDDTVRSKWTDVACDGIHLCLKTLKDVPLIVAGIMMTGTATAFPLMTYNDRKNAALLYGSLIAWICAATCCAIGGYYRKINFLQWVVPMAISATGVVVHSRPTQDTTATAVVCTTLAMVLVALFGSDIPQQRLQRWQE